MKNNSHNSMFLMKKQLQESIKSIPKENKHKFGVDLLKLIDYAHGADYDNFNF